MSYSVTIDSSSESRYTRDPQLLDNLADLERRRHAAEARARAKGPDISEDDDDLYEIFGCLREEDEIRSAFLTDRERDALQARCSKLEAEGKSRESAHQEVWGPFYRLRANSNLKRLRREHPSDDFIGSYPYQELARAHRAFRSEARATVQSALVLYRRLPRPTNGCRARSKRQGIARRRGSRRVSSSRRGRDPGGDSDPPGLGPLHPKGTARSATRCSTRIRGVAA